MISLLPSRRGTRRVAVLVAAAAAAVLVPSPAQAAGTLFLDPDDALGADLRRVRVVHTEAGLSVRVRMDRIVKDGRSRQQAMNVYVDTDAASPGPELRLATGLNEGTDWNLRRVSGWTSLGKVLHCSHDVSIDWAEDRAVVFVSRACLGDVDAVRVGVKAGEWQASTGTRTDWLRGRRWLSPSVRR